MVLFGRYGSTKMRIFEETVFTIVSIPVFSLDTHFSRTGLDTVLREGL